MARKKVNLAFVTNDAARKAIFKNRRRGLMKKVVELSTLCGVETCAVVFSPYEPWPDVWPNVAGAQQVISRFRRLSEIEQTRKMTNQADFTRQCIVKATELLRKTRVENREKELTGVVDRCLLTGTKIGGMNLPDLTDMRRIVDQDLKNLEKLMKEIQPEKDSNNHHQQQLLVPLAVAPPILPLPLQSSNAVVPGPMLGNLPPMSGMGVDNHGPGTQCLTASPSLPHPPLAVVPGPMVENQPPSIEIGMDIDGPMPQWAIDWMNAPSDQNPGFGNGLDDTAQPFLDNTDWSNSFFPWL